MSKVLRVSLELVDLNSLLSMLENIELTGYLLFQDGSVENKIYFILGKPIMFTPEKALESLNNFKGSVDVYRLPVSSIIDLIWEHSSEVIPELNIELLNFRTLQKITLNKNFQGVLISEDKLIFYSNGSPHLLVDLESKKIQEEFDEISVLRSIEGKITLLELKRDSGLKMFHAEKETVSLKLRKFFTEI